MAPELNAAALFQKEKEENIRAMTQDKNTKRIGRLFMDHMTDYKYGYYFTWMGRPIIQHPQDIVALQEVMMEVQPDLVIETGIAHGGSLILSASLLELLDIAAPLDEVNREVIGIDIEIRPQCHLDKGPRGAGASTIVQGSRGPGRIGDAFRRESLENGKNGHDK